MVQLNDARMVSRALVLPVLTVLAFHHPVETKPTVVNVVLANRNVVLVRERKPEAAAVPVAIPHLVAVVEPDVVHVFAGADLHFHAVTLADCIFTHCRFLSSLHNSTVSFHAIRSKISSAP